MKFAYYPGCSARSTCAELNEATHKVAAGLGLDLVQIDSATCTGARELRAIDPVNFYTLNVRILALAEREGLPLMTICNTCTLNVLDAHGDRRPLAPGPALRPQEVREAERCARQRSLAERGIDEVRQVLAHEACARERPEGENGDGQEQRREPGHAQAPRHARMV